MGRRWKWFLRPGEAVVDLVGQVVPDADVPGRWRRPGVPHVVPDEQVTSRCDGALVYVRTAPRSAAPGPNQRAGGYDSEPPDGWCRADRRRAAEGRRADG